MKSTGGLVWTGVRFPSIPPELIREYDLTPSALHKWIKNFDQSGSFKQKDNLTLEEKRLIELEKENKQLKMENDILKQAA